MTVKEFVEIMSEERFANLDVEDLVYEVSIVLGTKEYLPIEKKRNLLDMVVMYSMRQEEGIYKFDGIAKYVSMVMLAIREYTKLDFELDEMEDMYDELSETNLLPLVVKTFEQEYDLLLMMLDLKTEYELSTNSVEAQVSRFIDSLNDAFSGTLGDVLKNIGNESNTDGND